MKVKCKWVFGHEYGEWSDLVDTYSGTKQQWRQCKNCKRLSYRLVGYVGGVNVSIVNRMFRKDNKITVKDKE